MEREQIHQHTARSFCVVVAVPLSPGALHGLGLVQAGQDHSGHSSQLIGSFLCLEPRQAPDPLQGQQGIQTHTEVVVETPLQDDVQCFAQMQGL